jgi:cholesterol oxidase
VTAAHYDVVVVGSGFGGAVAALRLTEKGYRVAVLEAGARFVDSDFPKTSFDTRRFLFRPEIGCYGIQRIDALRHCLILSGAGVGGGSLVYANTLYEPLPPFYADPQWAGITDWKEELAPYYDQARRMLGAVTYPGHSAADDVMREVADQMGVGDTFHYAPVGVFFGSGDAATPSGDPYFGGAGPERRACRHCGECMTGCRHGAKNTLVKNYLHLAENLGAVVIPLTTVTQVVPRPAGGYAVTARHTKAKTRRPSASRVLTADHVVMAASALGTQRLLHRMRDQGHLPRLSRRLGELSRTNSESLMAVVAPDLSVDYTRGVAITSSFNPDEHTRVEPVRYGRGSNLMALLQSLLIDGDESGSRWRLWMRENWRQRGSLRSRYDMKRGSERTVIGLVMQSRDNSITTFTRSSRWLRRRVLSSRQGHGAPNPGWLPVAHEVAHRMAAVMGGTAVGSMGEPFEMPATAHFIGGCPIGADADAGVVDAYHRVFGHPGLHVVDGSTVSANLGANPSLTITAQAERAMAFWPNRGEPDTRPTLGAAYRRIQPTAPKTSAVAVDAPGALRLPVVEIT